MIVYGLFCSLLLLIKSEHKKTTGLLVNDNVLVNNEIKYDKFCSECGHDLIKNSNFCPGCGIKLSTQMELEKSYEEIKEENCCPKCGQTVYGYLEYCHECGEKLND